jgi:hypothetical protein
LPRHVDEVAFLLPDQFGLKFTERIHALCEVMNETIADFGVKLDRVPHSVEEECRGGLDMPINAWVCIVRLAEIVDRLVEKRS